MKNKFPEYLKYLIELQRYRLGDLAVSANVHASDLSRVVAAKRKCGARMAEQVIEALDEGDRAQALVNWLHDQVPSQFAELVEIKKAGTESTASVLNEDPANSELGEAMKFLSSESETNEPVRKLLLAMTDLFNKG